ncbi:hypothetical protein Q7P37_010525 [Cladosporium fusiforme]
MIFVLLRSQQKQNTQDVAHKKPHIMVWPFTSSAPKKTRPDDPMVAANDPTLRAYFTSLLDYTEPPEVFKASDVATKMSDAELASLGFGTWHDALPAIKVLAWESRAMGDCLIFYPNGKKVPESVSWMEVGPIRLRRRAKVYADDDDWD